MIISPNNVVCRNHKRRLAGLFFACFLLLAKQTVLACSGPGAMQAINENFQQAVLLAVLAGMAELGAVILYFKTRQRSTLILGGIITFFFLLHPAWTISAMIGDCGQAKASQAKIFTLIIWAIFVIQMLLFLLGRKKAKTQHLAL